MSVLFEMPGDEVLKQWLVHNFWPTDTEREELVPVAKEALLLAAAHMDPEDPWDDYEVNLPDGSKVCLTDFILDFRLNEFLPSSMSSYGPPSQEHGALREISALLKETLDAIDRRGEEKKHKGFDLALCALLDIEKEVARALNKG